VNQQELTELYCIKPQNFSWFLGAGASRSAGLPTATDIIWDLKRRFYCREENQDISRQDMQNPAVRDRIQSFMDSNGFPAEWADSEYTEYFERIFGSDLERQRRYLRAILSEDKLSLSVGNRVLGALLAGGYCRTVFTTNFDSVIEKAVAEVSGKSIAAYHLEGTTAVNEAINNEEYPIYCKLHGDFRHESLKNQTSELQDQNAQLSKAFMNACSRTGLIVAGYSGRDASVMELLFEVLKRPNPFPHGLFWTGLKSHSVPEIVYELLETANSVGVNASFIPIETFDTLLLRIWRNVDDKPETLNAKVQKNSFSKVSIPLPNPGKSNIILRTNALPIGSLPSKVQKIHLSKNMEIEEIRQLVGKFSNSLILKSYEPFYCWGKKETIEKAFGDALKDIEDVDISGELSTSNVSSLKGFFEQGLCQAVIRGKPLLTRKRHNQSWLIADRHAEDKYLLESLYELVGHEAGDISGLFTPATEFNPKSEQVSWAEALRVSIDIKDDRVWVLIDPDIWIWPPRAKRLATTFLDKRRGDRFNKKYNSLLDAWIKILFESDDPKSEIRVAPFSSPESPENPMFVIGRRTGFTRK